MASTVHPLVRDFTPSTDPSSSAPKFLENITDNPSGLATWVTFKDSSVTVPGSGNVEVPYTLTVPSTAGSGGHYGAIFVSTQNPDAKNAAQGVAISARIGSLLLVTVSGDIKASGSITSFTTDKTLYQKGPVTLTVTLKNDGSIHYYPTGSITVTNRITQNKQTVSFNKDHSAVLPGSSRTFKITLDNLGYGPLAISSDVEGVTPNGIHIPFTASATIWVLPLLYVGAFLIAFLLLLALFRAWLIAHDRKVLSKPSSTRKK